jgi:hypothetical protein
MEIAVLCVLATFTALFVWLNAVLGKHKYDECKECQEGTH